RSWPRRNRRRAQDLCLPPGTLPLTSAIYVSAAYPGPMPPPRLPPVLEGRASQRVLGVVCGLVGLGSVVPLLAWVYGLGAFAAWFWGLAAPGLAFVAITGVALRRSGRYPTLLVALVSGAVGGLAATVAYDLVRGPFVALGYQLFAPLSPYGILIVGPAAGWSASRDTLPPVSWALVATVVLIALWQQPWVVTAEPAPIAGRPAVVVSGGRFQPAWSRIPLGGCVVLDNRDASAYR